MSLEDPQTPTLSVVVALISGRVEHLEACLAALHRQQGCPLTEILVPYDAPCASVVELGEAYPAVRFLRAEGLDSRVSRSGAGREHHDTLRTIGLRAARGRYVALTEDHAVQDPLWCRSLVGLLDDHPEVAAVGGAVECGSPRLLNRAVYYCDFGRYQNPLPEGPARYVSDSNVAYRREALEAVRDTWEGDYHETVVHEALVEAGYQIWLTPRTTVWQDRGIPSLGAALQERSVWGRSFAGTRLLGAPLSRRLAYAGLSPALPPLLTLRLARIASSGRRPLGPFLEALPLIALLNAAWAWGEFVGYLTGRPAPAGLGAEGDRTLPSGRESPTATDASAP